jgi:neuropeptide Y receptor
MRMTSELYHQAEASTLPAVRPSALGTSLFPVCPNTSEGVSAWHANAMNTISSRDIDSRAKTLLIVAYAIFIVVGTLGNLLTCYVVARKTRMRTFLNLLIVNLAVSDVMLCVITQPLNIIKFTRLHWIFGDAMCKAVPLFAGTNVFVSTITISAIALYRYALIVHPTVTWPMDTSAIYVTLAVTWLLAILLASPLLAFSKVTRLELCPGVTLFDGCVEVIEMKRARIALSTGVLVFQYLIPTVILICTNVSICLKLHRRLNTYTSGGLGEASVVATMCVMPASDAPLPERRPPSRRRMSLSLAANQCRRRKTGFLLLAIAVAFAVSWLPLNVFNVIADVDDSLIVYHVDTDKLLFPICHLIVLFSAAVNPILYGWLNHNFRDEFYQLLCPRAHQRSLLNQRNSYPDAGLTRCQSSPLMTSHRPLPLRLLLSMRKGAPTRSLVTFDIQRPNIELSSR